MEVIQKGYKRVSPISTATCGQLEDFDTLEKFFIHSPSGLKWYIKRQEGWISERTLYI